MMKTKTFLMCIVFNAKKKLTLKNDNLKVQVYCQLAPPSPLPKS